MARYKEKYIKIRGVTCDLDKSTGSKLCFFRKQHKMTKKEEKGGDVDKTNLLLLADKKVQLF